MENRETEQMEPFRLETAFDQIEQLLQKLQEGEVSLEESFRLYLGRNLAAKEHPIVQCKR